MKIIVDSCVWSLLLRRRKTAILSSDEIRLAETVTDLIASGKIAILGPIRQEILSGLKENTNFERVRSNLASFNDEELLPEDYVEAARLCNLCRAQGIATGVVDILICAVAIRRKWKILTTDRGIHRILHFLNQAELHLAP